MTEMFDYGADPQVEWLYHVGPVGLVIGPNIIRDEDLTPPQQTAVDTKAVFDLLNSEPDEPALGDPWSFFEQILGWESRYVAGAPDGPPITTALSTRVDEHDLVLSPDWAVRELGTPEPDKFQILVRLATNVGADDRGVLDGWEAPPHQQFERLLRDTGIPIGVLVDRSHLRLIYAPRGETSGWLAFPLRSLGTVAGRTMLAGLKLILGHARLFTEPEERRLPKLLAGSREAQSSVSEELAEQVLGALHELLRAFYAADPKRIERLATDRPHHLYEGLLTTLMRLVFLLYAEDRDLMPSQRTGAAIEIYEQNYSVRGLYARLVEDRSLNPDTMDERVGGWGQLLALFRLVHAGHSSGWIIGRGGKLFDPNAFPFLEGRDDDQPLSSAAVLTIRDGALLRILEGLMTIEARSVTGERVRERLSYRGLDVEQIGSVYETIMGFTIETASGPSVAIKAGKNNRTPVFVDLDRLASTKANDRAKYLKGLSDRGQFPAGVTRALQSATNVDELVIALDPIVDERGSPKRHVTAGGTPILQPTGERRRTGSHYTPRTITEPIVRYAVQPAFERLGIQATPEQVLGLKVCDPAMGSGAFLVEACRALAARLVVAWSHHPGKRPIIPPDEDEELHARRLVAQRCLYGVDKNPLATDLAKLSLWLATLARDHEFTFLDHALKSGDSLVGLTQTQIAAVNWDESKPGLPLFRRLVKDRMLEVMKGRAEIQAAPDDIARAIQEQRHHFLEARVKDVHLIGDAIVAAFFAADKPRDRERKRGEVESWLGGSPVSWERLAALAQELEVNGRQLRPFHWQIEFPEVFLPEDGGFDVIVGNPPYLGGTKISGAISPGYFKWIASNVMAEGDKADLIAYFIRRIFQLLRSTGTAGLVTTSSVAEGDTRKAALVWLRQHGGQIYRAIKKQPWPGEANVDVSQIHLAKDLLISPCFLEGGNVSEINSFLNAGSVDHEPFQLKANEDSCFEGFVPYGEGFVINSPLAEAEIADLITHEPQTSEVIFPYLGGEEVTEDPSFTPARKVIYLAQMTEAEVKAKYPGTYKLLERKVRPYRMSKSARVARAPWWQFLWSRPTLYKKMRALSAIIVTSRVSKHHAFARVPTRIIPSTRLAVITMDRYGAYAVIQSRVHELWARYFGASRGATANYSPSECFETFPFPPLFASSSELAAAGQSYDDYRAMLMGQRGQGMTEIYNQFHDPLHNTQEVTRMRELHAQMDKAVLQAYGWYDLAARALPLSLNDENEESHVYRGRLFWPADFRDEVFDRLLALNAERHSEELVLGVAPVVREGGDAELERATSDDD
ncbi:hypothetical protein AB7M16_002032 [Bradyrhizobium sp. USDA 372]